MPQHEIPGRMKGLGIHKMKCDGLAFLDKTKEPRNQMRFPPGLEQGGGFLENQTADMKIAPPPDTGRCDEAAGLVVPRVAAQKQTRQPGGIEKKRGVTIHRRAGRSLHWSAGARPA